VTGRDEALGAQALERLQGSDDGEARFFREDAADEDDVDASVVFTVGHLGGLDILVNNAGIGVQARLVDTPIVDFDRVMAVNLRGPFLYARACHPHLAARAGCMIHIGSDAGVTGEPEIGAYSISKAALIMLRRCGRSTVGPTASARTASVPATSSRGCAISRRRTVMRVGRTTPPAGRRRRSKGSVERGTSPMPQSSSRAPSRRSAPGPCCSWRAA
jgi:NAD(P)-dependent dehydrogenase (short-subunit alcohol dehydrogenase family)